MMQEMEAFSELSRELLLVTDDDNANFLSKLLDHSRLKDKALSRESPGILPYHPDLMTVITLSTTTRWLDGPAARCAALMDIGSFPDHLRSLVKAHAASPRPKDEEFSVIQSGLEVILRMCMNSEESCKATLASDMCTPMLRLLADGRDATIPGLAAAILAVCFIKLPNSAEVLSLSNDAVTAVLSLLKTLKARWQASGEIDAETFYLATGLLQFCKRPEPERWLQRLRDGDVLETLILVTPALADSQHYLSLSAALNLMQPFVSGDTGRKEQLLARGTLTVVLDFLTTLSVQEHVGDETSRSSKSTDVAKAQQDKLEAILSALTLISTVLEDFPAGNQKVVDAHPAFILKALLRYDNRLLLCKTCGLIVSLADDQPDLQRVLRVEGVLSCIVDVLDEHARQTAEHVNQLSEEDLQGNVDVVIASGVALCAMLNGSPDNHMYMAATDNVGRVVDALMNMATTPRDLRGGNIAEYLDVACAELVTALSVLSRNMTNRTMLSSSNSLDAMAEVLMNCRSSAAVKEVMYILVLLVSKDNNAARHLVERTDFMPMLFSLVQEGPTFVSLENAAALVLVLVRDCKMNKGMLMRSGIPSVMATLQQHADPRVSSTTVQALSGVLTLLAMSRTMLEMVVKLGGLALLVNMLEYSAPAAEMADPSSSSAATARAISIQEAACVLLGCLSDASGKARSKILQCEGVIPRLMQKVISVKESEVLALLPSTETALPREAAGDSDEKGAWQSNQEQIAAVAANSSQQALMATLATLMQNSGPDNFVFQAAMQAMQKIDGATAKTIRHGAAGASHGEGDDWDNNASRMSRGEHGEDDFSEHRGQAALIPVDAKLQLALAAINALFSLMTSKHDPMEVLWPYGGAELIDRLLLLGQRLKESFEEEATKLLVVLLSNTRIQTAARESGLIVKMVRMTLEDESSSMLIAVKALAVVCRNSVPNQAQALEHGLLDKCVSALSSGMDIYSAKWVILVVNALVYDNAQAQEIILRLNAVPLLVRWLDVGPEHEVATAAARALAKSAKGNTAIQNAICEGGGIQAFVAMLDGKPFSLAVRAAAEALSDLAKDNTHCQDQIREAGTFIKLFELMKSMQSTSLVVTVMRTLAVLAHGNMANMEAIYALDCVPTLISMLAPDVGPIINAAAADLIRVLCSHRECQLCVISSNGIQALLTSLRENTYAAAQSAAVWSLNAVVQGQKATLPVFMAPDIMQTLMRCISSANGAAAGTVRLLLVMFLHSGRHEELCTAMEQHPEVLRSLLDMIKQGPDTEPTKWAASLLSTLCWQEDSIKKHMISFNAPKALAGTLAQTVEYLGQDCHSPGTVRTIVESTISTVQALISLTDTSVKSTTSAELTAQALDANCVALLCNSAHRCLPALLIGQEKDSAAWSQQLDKLLKPHLIALEYLLADTAPPELLPLIDAILSTPGIPDDMRQHATAVKSRFVKHSSP